MQLDLFGATDVAAIREAAAPVVSAGGAWLPPELLVFNAALRRGSLGEAVGVLNRVKTDVAVKVLLASGFTVAASNTRAALIAGVQMDVLAAARLRMTGMELRAAVPAVVTPVPVAQAPVELSVPAPQAVNHDAASLRDLRDRSVAAQVKFMVFYDAAGSSSLANLSADEYFTLADAKARTDETFASALVGMADDGFALRAKTSDGRDVMLNASAQRAGCWQLTRFDAKGEPWGDTQYETKAQAVREFLQDVDSRTVDTLDGIFADVAAVVAPAAPGASVSRVIEDAGEELTYNRRNRNRSAKGWGDIAHLNDALKVKEAVKANVWPKMDYKQLIDDGMQPMVAHIVKQVYDSVAVKPVVGRDGLDDAALEKYIAALNRLEHGVLMWARDPVALKQWANKNAQIAGAMLGRQTSLSDLAGESQTLLSMVYPGGHKPHASEIRMVGGNKLLHALQPGYEDINRAIKAIKRGWPEKREAWEVQGYRVIEAPEVATQRSYGGDEYYLTVNDSFVKSFVSQDEAQAAADAVKPFVLFGKRGFVDSFGSEVDAIDVAKERTQRQKTQGISEKGARVDSVERQGPTRRMEGEDISSERLITEFGLKGVNFGNWMKTPAARVEAQLNLNHAFDSLHDLADIVGVPPKAMSLDGMLGLAFGAQGSGSASAHFVPGVNEINLTRTSGAGFVAHEWGHALDHYYATLAGAATAEAPYLSEISELPLMKSMYTQIDGRLVESKVPRFGGLRPEVVGEFKVIVDAMNKRMETESEASAKQASYLSRGQSAMERELKMIRRDFAGHEEAFDVLGARVLASDFGDGKVALSRAMHASPVVVEIRDLYKSKFGRAYSVGNVKDIQNSIDSATFRTSRVGADVAHVPQKVSSDYARNAYALDQKKGGKPYWSTTREKFARAFDAFVSDALEAKHASNGYLSLTGKADETVPMGAERLAVNAAFRGLVAEIKVRETEKGGAALFSSGVAGGAKTMPMAEIDAEIARLRGQWPSMPKVTVVQAVGDLPFETPGNADGAYCDGHVYVVAGNVANLKQLQKVMAHECVMHHAIEEMLGDYGFSKLHSGIQKLKRNGDPVVIALAENIRSRYGVLPPEIETKEIVARAGEQCLDDKGNVKVAFGFMKSVFAGVAGWLRDHGISVPFSNLELQGVMHAAGAWIMQKPAREFITSNLDYRNLEGTAVSSRTSALTNFGSVPPGRKELARGVIDIEQPTTDVLTRQQAFSRWFGKSLLVDEDEQPKIMYHATKGDFQTFDRLKSSEGRALSMDTVGLWFSDNPSDGGAGMYATGVGASIYPVFLSIERPKVYDTFADFLRDMHAAEGRTLENHKPRGLGSTEGLREQLKLQGYDGIAFTRTNTRELVDAAMECKDKIKHAKEEEWAVKAAERQPYTEKRLRLEGKLGALNAEIGAVAGSAEFDQQYVWVAFEPEQIKSAIGNRGEFDRTNPNILFSCTVQADETGREGAAITVDGAHFGRVVSVAGEIVTQRIGRGGETVQHSMSRLSEPVAIGDVVEIKYQLGVGQVGGRAVEIDKGR